MLISPITTANVKNASDSRHFHLPPSECSKGTPVGLNLKRISVLSAEANTFTPIGTLTGECFACLIHEFFFSPE